MEGRVIALTSRVGLGDVRPDATMRLDAIARIVQDVSDHDAATADIAGMGIWIMRRLELELARVPRFRAELTARTWCSGVGAAWAERRTDLAVDTVHCVGATALWAHTNAERGTPERLPQAFDAVWGVSAHGRKVSARLRHEAPPLGADREPWRLRATDLDVLGHVNNAAYWAPVEEELARRGNPRVRRAEIEFRSGLDPDDTVTFVRSDRSDGFAAWLVVDDDVRASMLVTCAP
jgi:acyl-ACP thioesterase